MKAVEKDNVVEDDYSDLDNLECIKGFQKDFLAPANSVCQKMGEKKRFLIKTKYQKVDNKLFYMAEIIYGEKSIISESHSHYLTEELARPEYKDKYDHEPLMGKVVYTLLLHLVSSGLFQVVRAQEAAEKELKKKKKA